jgi:NAD(P)-dependent dehydrogenase (short-subunit alcohol dehydrogenase family)
MDGKRKIALITGATSGFGVVIARHLVKRGYALIVMGRSKDKLDSLLHHLKALDANHSIDPILCDLSSFRSIESACETIKKAHMRIDLMVLNAGIWNFKYVETEDKIEEILQVNLLSPILIFKNLKQLLPNDGNSKVIFTASGLHQGAINFEDIEFKNAFSGFKAYRQSKLGLILIARLLSNKKEYAGIAFYTVHPGMVNSGLGRNAGWFSRFIFKLLGKTKEKGAETHLYLIDQPTSDLTSGEYYSHCKIIRSSSESYNMNSANKLMQVIDRYIDEHIKNKNNI